ncbi:hypothetical protein L2E82_38571 [Cichorium intybus]|uniref:Uncharacterized protein n=1 Tax=Cichorium intybus TaxID=13427 RepID=A0ACB9AFH1_CICIN|nr:hypothetical protein L2E82_38571 [Cichorium intybus]
MFVMANLKEFPQAFHRAVGMFVMANLKEFPQAFHRAVGIRMFLLLITHRVHHCQLTFHRAVGMLISSCSPLFKLKNNLLLPLVQSQDPYMEMKRKEVH